jgi:hypothetical protein
MLNSGHRYVGRPQSELESAKICSTVSNARTCRVQASVCQYKSPTIDTANSWVSIAHAVRLERLPAGGRRLWSRKMRVFATGKMRDQARLAGGSLTRTLATRRCTISTAAHRSPATI